MSKKHPHPKRPAPSHGLTSGRKDLLSILVLYAICLVLFRGIVFEDKTFSAENDTAAAHSFQHVGATLEEREHVDILWMPYFFSGMPTFGNVAYVPHNVSYLQTLTEKTLNILFLSRTWSWYVVYYFLGGVFMFLLLRVLQFSHGAALFGAVVFMLAPYTIYLATEGHGSKLMALSYLPAVFMLTHMVFERRDILSFGLFAAAVGTLLLTNHMQIVYYGLLLIGLYWAYRFVLGLKAETRQSLIRTLLLFGGLVVAFGISAYIYLSVYEYSHYSIRGSGTPDVAGGLPWDYATNWSFHPQEIVTLLIPSFFGFKSPYYWGTMPFNTATSYIGLLPWLFALLALLYRRTSLVLFLSAVTVLMFLVSFGKHFGILYQLMFDYLPFFNKFRAPTMILHLLPLTVGVIGAAGLDAVLHDLHAKDLNTTRLKKGLVLTAGVLGGLLVVGLLVKGGLADWMISSSLEKEGEMEQYRASYAQQAEQIIAQLKTSRFDMLWKDFVKFVLLGISGIGLVFLYVNRNIKAGVFVTAVVALAVLDLVLVINKGEFIDPKPKETLEQQFQPDATTTYLLQQPGLFRIFPLGANQFMDNTYAYHGLQSIGGYSPAKLKIYQTMLDSCLYRGPDPNFPINMNIVNMLNVEYVITQFRLPEERFSVAHVDRAKQMITYRNPAVLPRAFFVDEVTVARSTDEVFRTLNSTLFDAGRMAVVEKELPAEVTAPDSSTASVTAYSSRAVSIRTFTSAPALLVVSEVYYPAGWKAFVDGKETEIFKTNYVLRSLVVPAGSHEVTFTFDPGVYQLGYTITRIAWGVAILCILIGLWQIPAIRALVRRKAAVPLHTSAS